MAEKINQPEHYQSKTGLTVHDVIEAWDLNFALGNVIKYTLRAGKKQGENEIDDLKKAKWYLQEIISKREKGMRAGLEELGRRENMRGQLVKELIKIDEEIGEAPEKR